MLQHGGSAINGLRAEDVNPRLVFHHGVPSGSSSLAYDSIHNILAIATRFRCSISSSFFDSIAVFGDLFLLMIFFFFFDAIDVVRDGRIKLSGENNTQALLQSDDAVPSKFLLVIFRIGVCLMKFEFFFRSLK